MTDGFDSWPSRILTYLEGGVFCVVCLLASLMRRKSW